MQKVISEVYNVVFGVRKQFTECEKEVSDCEKLFLEGESFRSAKVLPEAYRDFFYAGPLGQNSFSRNENRYFFAIYPDTPPKSQMVAP